MCFTPYYRKKTVRLFEAGWLLSMRRREENCSRSCAQVCSPNRFFSIFWELFYLWGSAISGAGAVKTIDLRESKGRVLWVQ